MSDKSIEAAAEALGNFLALEEANAVAIQQAQIVTSVLDVINDVALDAVNRPVRTAYDEGRRDGEVDLVKRLFEVIKKGRGQ